MEEFKQAVEYLTHVRSFGDFVRWFLWLPGELQLLFGAGIFGLIVVCYMFLVATLPSRD